MPNKVRLSDLVDAALQANEEYGDIEVVFVGESDNGQFINPYVDVSVCKVTNDSDGQDRIVFALVLDPLDGRTEFVQ